MKRKLFSLLITCILMIGILPLSVGAEMVTETTGQVDGGYVYVSGKNLCTIEMPSKGTMVVTFGCTGEHLMPYLRGNSGIVHPIQKSTHYYPGSAYYYGSEVRYELDAGTYLLATDTTNIYFDGGYLWYRVTIRYDSHTHNYQYTKDVKPTCTSQGYSLYTCSCGETQKKNYVAKLPHTNVADPEVPATCMKTGITAGTHCSVCNTTTSGRETIPIADHSYKKGTNYDTCIYCGQYAGKLASDLNWVLDSEGNLVVSGSGSMYPWDQPTWSELTDKVVTVTLPEGLENIGYAAFKGMNISEMKLPNTVTSISESAFANCTKLSSVVLPNSLTSIGSHAFTGCSALQEITIPGKVTNIGKLAFANSGLQKVVLSDGITSITAFAFAECGKLQEVILPEGLESIWESAFSKCTAIKEFTIPENVSVINQGVFQGCTSLHKIHIPKKVHTIREEAFQGCTSLVEIDLYDTYVSYIDERAFSGCTSLKEVEFSKDITVIEREAFAGCTGLKQIVLHRRIPELKKNAFQGVIAAIHCPTILQAQWESKWSTYDHGGTFYAEAEHTYEAVVTPPTCTKKGYTTYTCTECGVSYKDDYVDVVHNVENGICTLCQNYGICGENLVWTRGASKLTISGTGDMYDYALSGETITTQKGTTPWHNIYNGSFVCEVIIEDGVTSIGANAFYGLENFVRIQIADSVTQIGEAAFQKCKLLKEVTLPNSVTSVGAQAFSGCSKLGKVTLSENMTAIPDHMFWFCGELKEIRIPASVTQIGGNAFNNCSLKEVVLPDGVTEIGERAFSDCHMTTVTLPEAVTKIKTGTFLGCEKLTHITIPEGVTEIGEYAFSGCTNLAAITIPENVRTIGEGAFRNCSSLITFTLPANVTEISNKLLELCTGLKTVYFEGNHYPWYWQYQNCFKDVTASGYYTVDVDFVVPDTTSGSGRVTWERYAPCVEHDYGAWEVVRTATCATGGVEISTCSTCKHQRAQTIVNLDHSWTEWTITKEPTKWWEGSQSRTCSVCGETETETLPVVEVHVHEYTKTITPPTCTTDGYTTYTCTCGDTKIDNKVVASHKWDDGEVTKEPTEEAEGEKTFTCTTCKEVKVEPIPKLDHVHNYTAEVTPPTCVDEGYTTYTCACGDTKVENRVPVMEHKFEAGICTVCNEKDPDYVKPSEPTEPEPTEPEPTEPEPTEPESTEPEPTEPRPTEPDPTEPETTEPEPTEPEETKTVTRISGTNRIKTAIASADKLKEVLGISKFQTIVVANAMDFPDALSGSYLAAVAKAPILLYADGQALVTDYIKNNLAPGGIVYILGGEKSVSNEIITKLPGIPCARVAGSGRFATSLAIIRKADEIRGSKPDKVLICHALAFADSLSASATGLPILLVNGAGSLNADQKAYLDSVRGAELYVIGGKNSVSEDILTALNAYDANGAERLFGSGRELTSVEVAKKFFPEAKAAALASSLSFPDGLSGGLVAYAMNMPLLLTRETKESVAASYITERSITEGYVIGGTDAVADTTAKTVFGIE